MASSGNRHVVKASYGKLNWRYTLDSETEGTFSYLKLAERLRSALKIPADAVLTVTYVDVDGDVITLTGDDDLKDAFLYQGLNPLRVTISAEAASPAAAPAGLVAVSAPGEPLSVPLGAKEASAAAPVSAAAAACPAADAVKSSGSSSANEAPFIGSLPHESAQGPAAAASSASASSKEASQTAEAAPALKTGPSADAPDALADVAAGAAAGPEAGAAGPAPAGAAPGAAAGAPCGVPEVDLEASLRQLAEDVEAQLKGVLGASLEEYEPLLKSAPAKIAEVLETALQSGLSVSFEPIFEPGSGFRGSSRSSSWRRPPAATAAAADCAPAPAPSPAAASSLKSAAPAAEAAPAAVPVAPAASCTAPSADKAEKAASAGSSTTPAAAAAAAPAATCAATAGSADGATGYPTVHTGIICDGCDMNPLVGPRFKSSVKFDYDLCESCFSKVPDPLNYTRLNKPVFRPLRLSQRPSRGGPCSWNGPCHPGNRSMRCAPAPHWGGPLHTYGVPHHAATPAFTPLPAEPKLDSRFVRDVTIFDGTEMQPQDQFTKIWRLRNTGNLPWPQHTCIMHIGGDMLGVRNPVMLEIPEIGVAPGAEFEVSVDMVAPNKPGRYISHWRLVAPGGPKFGHRVWALVQVVPAGSPSPLVSESLASTPTNIPAPPEDASAPPPPPETSKASSENLLVTPSSGSAVGTVPQNGASVVKTTADSASAGSGAGNAPAPGAGNAPAPAAPTGAYWAQGGATERVDPLVAVIANAVPPSAARGAAPATADAAKAPSMSVTSVDAEGSSLPLLDEVVKAAKESLGRTKNLLVAAEGVNLKVEQGSADSASVEPPAAAVVTVNPGELALSGTASEGSDVESTTLGGFAILGRSGASAGSIASSGNTVDAHDSAPGADIFPRAGEAIEDGYVMAEADGDVITSMPFAAAAAVAAAAAAAAASAKGKGPADGTHVVVPAGAAGVPEVAPIVSSAAAVEAEAEAHASSVAEAARNMMFGDAEMVSPAREEGAGKVGSETEVEGVMLDQLEAMGFEGRAFNLDMLRQHNMDVNATLEVLVQTAEWDPIIKELQEMGFMDESLNRRLMLKNQGSLMGTVKDLVQLVRDSA